MPCTWGGDKDAVPHLTFKVPSDRNVPQLGTDEGVGTPDESGQVLSQRRESAGRLLQNKLNATKKHCGILKEQSLYCESLEVVEEDLSHLILFFLNDTGNNVPPFCLLPFLYSLFFFLFFCIFKCIKDGYFCSECLSLFASRHR